MRARLRAFLPFFINGASSDHEDEILPPTTSRVRHEGVTPSEIQAQGTKRRVISLTGGVSRKKREEQADSCQRQEEPRGRPGGGRAVKAKPQAKTDRLRESVRHSGGGEQHWAAYLKVPRRGDLHSSHHNNNRSNSITMGAMAVNQTYCVTVLQYVQISNHYVVHLKLTYSNIVCRL